METLDALRRRIQSARDLHGIVRTMKALAAASIRQFEQSVQAVDVYSKTIDIGLRIVMEDPSGLPDEKDFSKNGETLYIIFGSDQGMCGQFNENIVEFAIKAIETRSSSKDYPPILCVGLRTASHLSAMGYPFEELFPVPGTVNAINRAVRSLLFTINQWREEGSIHRVVLFYNRTTSGVTYQATQIQLIPVDLSLFQAPVKDLCPSRSLPTYSIDRELLLSRLLRQYLFVQLFRAYAESLSSENASRLMTMQAAEKNIEERLDEYNARYHSQRQELITSELLDIVSGFEVLSN